MLGKQIIRNESREVRGSREPATTGEQSVRWEKGRCGRQGGDHTSRGVLKVPRSHAGAEAGGDGPK